jgi:hypothetical protein
MSKNVGETFDVSVDLPLGVQVVEAFEDLAEDDGNVPLVQPATLGQVQR